jgi:hypothetical protein
MSIFEWTNPDDDGQIFEMRYVVTQFADEGPEYVEWREKGNEAWNALPPFAMPPDEAMKMWHGELHHTPGSVELKVTCQSCGIEQPAFNLDHFQLLQWRQGVKIQDILPDESPDRREVLISATCGTCFDKMFAGE